MSMETPQRSVDVKKTIMIGGHGENPNPKKEKQKMSGDMRAFAAEALREGKTGDEARYAKELLLNHGYRWDDNDPERSYAEVMSMVEKSERKAQEKTAELGRQQKHQAVWDQLEAEENRKREKIQAELRAAQPPVAPRAQKIKDARMFNWEEMQKEIDAKRQAESGNPVSRFFKKLFG